MQTNATGTVLITGAAAGIGRTAALRFARAGWRCLLVDRDAEELDVLITQMPAASGLAHIAHRADLAVPQEIAALAEGAPFLDAIINNAGISDNTNVPLVEQDAAQFARLVELNLEAPARVFAALAPMLRPGGRVVNVASGAGLHAIPYRGAYSASKAGLIAQTRALARVRRDLRVCALCPGFVHTDLVAKLVAAGRLDPIRAAGKTPLGRIAEPAELAEALFFLASEQVASFVDSTLTVDGGASIYGGSALCAPAEYTTLPLDLSLVLEVIDDKAHLWSSLCETRTNSISTYPATLDASVLDTLPGERLAAVHAAAKRFGARHAKQASLTVLLPAAECDTECDWRVAGDAAAARMMIATQACEWGARGLRINAIEVPAHVSTVALAPLLRYVAGAGAQFLTGQVLRVHG